MLSKQKNRKERIKWEKKEIIKDKRIKNRIKSKIVKIIKDKRIKSKMKSTKIDNKEGKIRKIMLIINIKRLNYR